ncbi:MAG TPA: hypothetical protein VJC09_02375 [Candidatus Saccharimonadales bacterium]|nr:hypothetical protein [Candidatus Saccharimonadales bacterium]
MSLKDELQGIGRDEARTVVRDYVDAKHISIDIPSDDSSGPRVVVEEFMEAVKSSFAFTREELEKVDLGATLVVGVICRIAKARETPPDQPN